MEVKISASTNPPPISSLNEYVSKLNETNVDYIHCDVMDGHFVKAKTFNHKKVAQIKSLTDKPLDVHLMVKHPQGKIKKYVKAGADIISIHYEAFKNKKKLLSVLQNIKKLGAFAGLAFNPSTSVLDILPYIYYCDLLLVMSVVPGKSGQEFMPETLLRLNTINKFLKAQGLDVVVEVDGGVNNKNLPLLIEKGVNSVVMGSYLYNSEDLQKTISKAKSVAQKAEITPAKQQKLIKSKISKSTKQEDKTPKKPTKKLKQK